MKRILLTAALASALLLGLSLPSYGQARIATISLQKVFENYWKKAEADAALQEKGAEMDKEMKSMVEDYRKTRETYQKLQESASDQVVAADEREKRKKAAEAKLLSLRESEQSIESFRRQATATLDERKRQMRDKILAEIKTAVNAKAKSAGFTLVLDASAETYVGTPVLVYTNGDNDITDDVLNQLNSTAPTSAIKATDKNGDKKK